MYKNIHSPHNVQEYGKISDVSLSLQFLESVINT